MSDWEIASRLPTSHRQDSQSDEDCGPHALLGRKGFEADSAQRGEPRGFRACSQKG